LNCFFAFKLSVDRCEIEIGNRHGRDSDSGWFVSSLQKKAKKQFKTSRKKRKKKGLEFCSSALPFTLEAEKKKLEVREEII